MNPQIAALQFITRCLSNDVRPESISALRTAIHSQQLPWEAVVSLANNHLLTPVLWVVLTKKNLTDELPDELRDYLRELHQLNKERNAKLRAQLLEAVRQLNRIDITPVLLKGAMHLVTDVYGDPGARIMTDIDLLVPREKIDACLHALHELGYEAEEDIHSDYHEDHHHCAPLFRPGDYGSLEVHRSLTENPYVDILPTEIGLAEAQPLDFKGLSMKALSPTHRLLHNILHSQLVDHNHADGIIPLRSLHEVITESTANQERIDWSIIQSRMEQHNRGNALRAYLYLAHKLFGTSFPEGVGKTLSSRLYYQRCCAQLSWQWANEWGLRLGRYSADTMRKRYGCENGWIAVNRARFWQLRGRVSAFLEELRNKPRNSRL
ncbi:MAG: nucleotidyltransferase family protein [Thiogranum sp.]